MWIQSIAAEVQTQIERVIQEQQADISLVLQTMSLSDKAEVTAALNSLSSTNHTRVTGVQWTLCFIIYLQEELSSLHAKLDAVELQQGVKKQQEVSAILRKFDKLQTSSQHLQRRLSMACGQSTISEVITMRRAAESWFAELDEWLQSHFLGWKVELEKLDQEWELE